jgi:GntR family transcriptional regulator
MKKSTKIDEVVKTVHDRIVEGIYVSGQRLPSERDMAEEFDVSRGTIRAALLRLQSDGLIDIVPRGGIFVRANPPKLVMGPQDPTLPVAEGLELKRAGSFIRDMQKKGRNVIVRFLEPSSITPLGEELAAKMRTTPDVEVLRRYRVHLVDHVPYRILDSYYLSSYAGELLGQDDNYIPLFKWLRENKGLRASRAFEKISCRMPSAEEAAILHIARNQPVVEMDRWVWGEIEEREEEVLFEYTRIVANASLHDFTYTYDIDEEASQ